MGLATRGAQRLREEEGVERPFHHRGFADLLSSAPSSGPLFASTSKSPGRLSRGVEVEGARQTVQCYNHWRSRVRERIGKLHRRGPVGRVALMHSPHRPEERGELLREEASAYSLLQSAPLISVPGRRPRSWTPISRHPGWPSNRVGKALSQGTLL